MHSRQQLQQGACSLHRMPLSVVHCMPAQTTQQGCRHTLMATPTNHICDRSKATQQHIQKAQTTSLMADCSQLAQVPDLDEALQPRPAASSTCGARLCWVGVQHTQNTSRAAGSCRCCRCNEAVQSADHVPARLASAEPWILLCMYGCRCCCRWHC